MNNTLPIENVRLKEVINAIKKRGIYKTQEQIGDRIEFSQPYLSDIVNNRKDISDSLLLLLDLAFNVNRNYIRYGEGEIFKNIEVIGNEDNNSGANLDQQDLNQSPDLKRLVEHQEKLLQKVEQIEKAVGDLKKDSDKVLLLLAQRKTSGTGNKRGRVG